MYYFLINDKASAHARGVGSASDFITPSVDQGERACGTGGLPINLNGLSKVSTYFSGAVLQILESPTVALRHGVGPARRRRALLPDRSQSVRRRCAWGLNGKSQTAAACPSSNGTGSRSASSRGSSYSESIKIWQSGGPGRGCRMG